jgi:transmembrane sensor
MNKQLLEKFVKGECTAEEAAQVQQWMDEHPEQLDAWLQEIWQEDSPATMPAAMEAALLEEAAAMPGFVSTQPTAKIIKSRRLYWSAAAAILISIAGWWWMQGSRHRQPDKNVIVQHIQTIIAPAGQPYRFVLPDQSVVWLKANARLQVDTQSYKQAARTVQLLSGEAFFEVQKDKAHPFIVQHGAVETRVLGTSFSVQTVAGNGTVQVTVATGKVEVSHRKKVLDVLLPGKQISVQPQTGVYTKQQVPVWMASFWKEASIQLTNAGFEELTLAMSTIYGVQLQTNNPLVKKKNYNIRLDKSMPVQQVITVLAILNHNQFEKLNNTTYLLY